MSLRNSPMFCGRKFMNLQPHDKFSTDWNLNYQDQMLSTSYFFNTDYGEKRYSEYLFVVLIFKMIPVAMTFYFNCCRMEDLEKKFLWQKCLHSRRVSTQNLRIHAKCSAIWSGFWPILVPDRIKSVQNTLSQRTGLVILWSAACNPILHILTGTYK